jgi:hypothetical protein
MFALLIFALELEVLLMAKNYFEIGQLKKDILSFFEGF